jgi:plastocyanin
MHPGFYRTRDAAYVVSRPLSRVCLLARSGRNWKPAMNLNAVKCVSLVVGALSCCAATPAPVRINVTLIDYSFVPDRLTLEHDIRYQLHLENHGNDTHEFTAPVFFATTDIGNPEALNRERSEVVVLPGESKDVFLTPHSPGTYDPHCSDHDWAGMVGGIVVR